MLTVARLRKMLSRLPSDAVVVARDHDQSDDEMNGYVQRAEICDGVLPRVQEDYPDVTDVVVIQI